MGAEPGTWATDPGQAPPAYVEAQALQGVSVTP